MRIAFFLRHEFHKPILLPIADQLKSRHAVRVSASKWDLVDFNPHVFVAAENLRAFRFHYYLPFTLFVHTRHGLASKGVAVQSARFSHYCCVTSFPMMRWYQERRASPRRGFWIAGYPQMDALHQAEPKTRLPSSGRKRSVVLYAPTFQFGFTSIRMLGQQAIALLQGDPDAVELVIKPHPLIGKHQPDWLAWLRQEAARSRNVVVATDIDADLMPFLSRADVLVTDASSAMLEFLALDRPIVLLTNPEHKTESFYDPAGFEWAWRDMGEEVHRIEDLPGALTRALRQPEARADRRAHYRRWLFGDLLDGRSAQRVSERIDHLQFETAGDRRMALGRAWSGLVRLLGGRSARAPITASAAHEGARLS